MGEGREASSQCVGTHFRTFGFAGGKEFRSSVSQQWGSRIAELRASKWFRWLKKKGGDADQSQEQAAWGGDRVGPGRGPDGAGAAVFHLGKAAALPPGPSRRAPGGGDTGLPLFLSSRWKTLNQTHLTGQGLGRSSSQPAGRGTPRAWQGHPQGLGHPMCPVP